MEIKDILAQFVYEQDYSIEKIIETFDKIKNET